MINVEAAGALRVELERLLFRAVTEGITPSAVCAVALDGRILEPIAVGDAVRFGDEDMRLASRDCVPATTDTVYDLASITKIFTSITVLTLVEEGLLDLDEPVGTWLAPYRSGAKAKVTLRQLLTHTSGLPGTWQGWRGRPLRDRPDLLTELLELDLNAAPGTQFTYSCVGFNTMMALAEQVSGSGWSALVTDRVMAPLARADQDGAALTFAPDPAACAATEHQPEFGRGMVCGTVHDESAHALGGMAGNAGLFGTARALLGFGEWLRTGTGYPEPGAARSARPTNPLLSESMLAELWRDQLPGILGSHRVESGGPGYGHGLGLRIGQLAWMGTSGSAARGHNGFTGTSLLMDEEAGLSIVLLTNRVHPSRTYSDVQPLRAAVANAVYRADRPRRGASCL